MKKIFCVVLVVLLLQQQKQAAQQAQQPAPYGQEIPSETEVWEEKQ